jgi:hypothetical protein
MSGHPHAEICGRYEAGLQSIPQIADALEIPRSRVRSILIKSGVALRTRADGVRLAGGRMSETRKGKSRSFTDEWCKNISAARRAHAEVHAAGVSKKASGREQHTRGPNKHRQVSVTTMEARIGRRLLQDEVVHHIDGDPSNNSPNNLALMTRSGHSRHHRFLDKLSGNARERNEDGRFR